MYLPDRPCPSGHRSLRYTSNAGCLACLRVNTAPQADVLERGEAAPKTCRKCGETYVGRQCPACQRASNARWRARNREGEARRQRERVEAVRQFVRAARQHPCVDCKGEFPWYAMEFDHRSDRADGDAVVAKMVGQGNLERVKIEIAKCDLVCGTCHNIRTYLRRTGGDASAVPAL